MPLSLRASRQMVEDAAMNAIEDALLKSDLFVAIGTSGAVYPAAGYAAQAREFGIPTLALNLEAADNAGMFAKTRLGRASETVPAFVTDILAGGDGAG